MEKKLISLSAELVEVIVQIQGKNGGGFGANVEKILWRSKEVRDAAEQLQVEDPKRPLDGRGRWER